MGKAFISQNIGKEISPYSIQLLNTEGGHWEDAYPFNKNIVRYNTSATGHQSGEPMYFRIWPVEDPDYLELICTKGGSEWDEETFSWESTDGGKSIINDGSILYCSGGHNAPYYCNFNIYPPASSYTAPTLELEVFLGGESGEPINLGALCIIHDQNLS